MIAFTVSQRAAAYHNIIFSEGIRILYTSCYGRGCRKGIAVHQAVRPVSKCRHGIPPHNRLAVSPHRERLLRNRDIPACGSLVVFVIPLFYGGDGGCACPHNDCPAVLYADHILIRAFISDRAAAVSSGGLKGDSSIAIGLCSDCIQGEILLVLLRRIKGKLPAYSFLIIAVACINRLYGIRFIQKPIPCVRGCAIT